MYSHVCQSAAENLHLTGYGTFSPYYGTDFIEILLGRCFIFIIIHKNEWFNKKINVLYPLNCHTYNMHNDR